MTVDAGEIGEALRKGRLVRILTSGSVILAILYVMAFVYVKTYLAVFGFQVELTSLSVIDLLLLHRYFVGQHFFILAGLLQAHLFWEFRWKGVREQRIASFLAFLAPGLVLLAAYGLSIWSEPGVPKGFNIAAPGLWIALLLGWLAGAASYWVARKALRRPTSIRDATWIILAPVALYLSVATYRIFSAAVARDRLNRQDFQILSSIDTDGGVFYGPCMLLHIDSRAMYMNCKGERRVIQRDKLRAFRIVPAPSQVRPPQPGPQSRGSKPAA